ncbi:MAG: hypothetical protein LBO67_03070 [Spirochaetaceae bacterium]|jgi:hypothetical protein|nr:hypothetical protein [Spirochaetaceae bacterium]
MASGKDFVPSNDDDLWAWLTSLLTASKAAYQRRQNPNRGKTAACAKIDLRQVLATEIRGVLKAFLAYNPWITGEGSEERGLLRVEFRAQERGKQVWFCPHRENGRGGLWDALESAVH